MRYEVPLKRRARPQIFIIFGIRSSNFAPDTSCPLRFVTAILCPPTCQCILQIWPLEVDPIQLYTHLAKILSYRPHLAHSHNEPDLCNLPITCNIPPLIYGSRIRLCMLWVCRTVPVGYVLQAKLRGKVVRQLQWGAYWIFAHLACTLA
jgi:hypothetical protein